MLTPQQAAGKTFPRAVLNGYNMTRVDEFLDRLIPDYTALYEENAALNRRVEELTIQLGELAARLDTYRQAEQAADEAMQAARSLTGQLLEEARRHQRAVEAALACAEAPEDGEPCPPEPVPALE